MKKNNLKLEDLVNDGAVVHSMPIIYDRLNQVINHPRSSVADIAKIISEDQGLASRILKMANSPMFGYYEKIDTINKAVTIIGTKQLRDLALAISVMGAFKGIPEDVISMGSFWKHSIACGITARVIAISRRDTNVERFFVSSMLHDVGQLILCTRAPELFREMIDLSVEREQQLFAVQRSILGFDHGDIGGGLLKIWKIPASIAEPVCLHHSPMLADVYPDETALLHVADVVAHALQVGTSGDQYVPTVNPQALDRLNVPSTQLSTILKQVDAQLKETVSILSDGVA